MRSHPCLLPAIAIAILQFCSPAARAMEPDDAGSPAAGSPAAEDRTDRIIVKYRQNRVNLKAAPQLGEEFSAKLSARTKVPLKHNRLGGVNSQILTLPEAMPLSKVREIAANIARDPTVEYAEPDAIMETQQVSDTRYNDQWHYYEKTGGINLPKAWQMATGKSVVVAILDTGILPHQDIGEQVLPGYDFVSDPGKAKDGDARDPDPTDMPCSQSGGGGWHGLHVAGTVAAVTNNGTGVAGVARDAKILPVRVLGKRESRDGCRGTGYMGDIADGMRWAVGLLPDGMSEQERNKHPAQVLNLSLGGEGPCPPTYQDAIRAVRARNATIVVAAGNDHQDLKQHPHRPAVCSDVITVAATNRAGARAAYSNYGRTVAIAAPGGERRPTQQDGVLSTWNQGETAVGADSYAFKTGTSMATPHVTGVVALLYQVDPAMTPARALAILRKSARPFPMAPAGSATPACTTSNCGAGILDAEAAVREAQKTITSARR